MTNVPAIHKRLTDDPCSLADIFEEIADMCHKGHPIFIRYTVPELLVNLILAIQHAQEDCEALRRYATDLERDSTTPDLNEGIHLLTSVNCPPSRIADWLQSVQDYAKSWREWIEIKKYRDAKPTDATHQAAGTTLGQPGHLKNKLSPPDDVSEVNRMMNLKRWQGKLPIEVCRAYIREKHKNTTDEFIETQAQSLKRKRNRHVK